MRLVNYEFQLAPVAVRLANTVIVKGFKISHNEKLQQAIFESPLN